MKRAAAILVTFLVSAWLGAAALATPPADADPRLHEWFESLTDPQSGTGCCAESDCKILADADWRALPDGYEIRVDGAWYPVPPERVLQRRPNPTGRPVACYTEYYNTRKERDVVLIYCFVRPEEV